MVRRSGKVIVITRRLTLLSLGFQFLFDRSKSLFRRRASLVDRDFAHNAPFETSQARLLGALQVNQVEAAMGSALRVSDAYRQIQGGFELVACRTPVYA